MAADLLTPLPCSNITLLALIALMLPLLSFLLNSGAVARYAWQASIAACFFMVLSSLISMIILVHVWNGTTFHTRMTWFVLGETGHTIGLFIDNQGALMIFLVTFISLLVHLYSTQYMKDDPGYQRYFAFLGLFTFSMMGILLADNLLVIFVFWELVGFSSYLLIGHWYHQEPAARAAKKAFIVNRIGDVGFILGIAVLWAQFRTLDLETLKEAMSSSSIQGGSWVTSAGIALDTRWLTFMGLGIFMGAVGKSAQFPLQVWLPDAMEGPTPVSALIHAATMVAAGVFLMCRVVALLDMDALSVIAVTGGLTAFMGAIAALTQHDIKKVLAYSTISQLGYMLMGVGIGAPGAALFHLFTHAFFKAALFLAAGSVIYALHQYAHRHQLAFDAQDMRNMGGLRAKLPVTFIVYLVATLALVGVPMFSGFLSKDALLSASFGWSEAMASEGHRWTYIVPVFAFTTVVLTAIYMGRQVLLVFFGELRIKGPADGLKESSHMIKFVLVVLGLFSLGIVWSLDPFDYNASWFLTLMPIPASSVPGLEVFVLDTARANALDSHTVVGLISIVLVLLGFGFSWFKYRPRASYALGYQGRAGFSFLEQLSFKNWYLDPLYRRLIVNPLMSFSRAASRTEKAVIDKFIDVTGVGSVIFAHIVGWFDRAFVDGFVNFSVFFAGKVGVLAKSFQYGKIQNYIILAVLSTILIILLIL